MRPLARGAAARGLRLAANAEDAIAVGVFWVLAAIVFAQFFTRYFLNDPIGWTEEIARYLLILCCYTGAVVVTRKDEHIRLEVIGRFVPPGVEFFVHRYVIALGLACLWIYLTYVCATFALRSRQHMTSVDLSLKLVWWPVFACFAAIAVHSVANFLLMRRSR